MDPGHVQDRRERYYKREDAEQAAGPSHDCHHDEPLDRGQSSDLEELGDLEDDKGRGHGGDGHKNGGGESPQRTDHDLVDIDALNAVAVSIQTRAGLPRDDQRGWRPR